MDLNFFHEFLIIITLKITSRYGSTGIYIHIYIINIYILVFS
jgi:hypothetical protein